MQQKLANMVSYADQAENVSFQLVEVEVVRSCLCAAGNLTRARKQLKKYFDSNSDFVKSLWTYLVQFSCKTARRKLAENVASLEALTTRSVYIAAQQPSKTRNIHFGEDNI